jgi:hypothetical protein
MVREAGAEALQQKTGAPALTQVQEAVVVEAAAMALAMEDREAVSVEEEAAAPPREVREVLAAAEVPVQSADLQHLAEELELRSLPPLRPEEVAVAAVQG